MLTGFARTDEPHSSSPLAPVGFSSMWPNYFWKTFFFGLYVCLTFVGSLGVCDSDQGPVVAVPVIQETEWTRYRPFVPEKQEYSFELGSMWEKNSAYWLGASYGRHLGRCVFSETQTCQQYIDVIGGVGGRDGLTTGLVLGSVRWQFVNFPSYASPLARVFVGYMNIRDDLRNYNALSYGVGYGWTVSVHESVDLKIEGRVGGGDHIWSQAFLAVNLKMEQWLNYFAGQLKDLGVGTAVMTGKAIRGTLRTSGEVMGEVVGKPVQKVLKATVGDKDASDEDASSEDKPSEQRVPSEP